MKALKQVLDRGLNLKKVHRAIKFNQEARVKPYIDMKTEMRTKVKPIIILRRIY